MRDSHEANQLEEDGEPIDEEVVVSRPHAAPYIPRLNVSLSMSVSVSLCLCLCMSMHVCCAPLPAAHARTRDATESTLW